MDTSNEKIIFDVDLHYFLEQQDIHLIDAKLHNNAERFLIASIKDLSQYAKCSITVKVGPKEEGGIVDFYEIICEFVRDNVEIKDALLIIITAFFNNFFRPKSSKLDDISKRFEIAEKVKAGNFTEDEAGILLRGDKKLNQWKSKYYESISNESSIVKIEANCNNRDENQSIISSCIERRDFDSHVIKQNENFEKTVINGTTIYIISPILVKGAAGRKAKWKGVYSGKPIEFKLLDQDFLNQVYNKEVKFGNGTCIKCSLTITTTISYPDNDPDNPDIKTNYTVDKVTEWADDESFYYETKKYKRMKSQGKYTGSLFDDYLRDDNSIKNQE